MRRSSEFAGSQYVPNAAPWTSRMADWIARSPVCFSF